MTEASAIIVPQNLSILRRICLESRDLQERVSTDVVKNIMSQLFDSLIECGGNEKDVSELVTWFVDQMYKIYPECDSRHVYSGLCAFTVAYPHVGKVVFTVLTIRKFTVSFSMFNQAFFLVVWKLLSMDLVRQDYLWNFLCDRQLLASLSKTAIDRSRAGDVAECISALLSNGVVDKNGLTNRHRVQIEHFLRESVIFLTSQSKDYIRENFLNYFVYEFTAKIFLAADSVTRARILVSFPRAVI